MHLNFILPDSRASFCLRLIRAVAPRWSSKVQVRRLQQTTHHGKLGIQSVEHSCFIARSFFPPPKFFPVSNIYRTLA